MEGAIGTFREVIQTMLSAMRQCGHLSLLPLLSLFLVKGVWSMDQEPIVPLERTSGEAPELVELGRRLFHDVRLSANDTVSCAHCHPLGRGGADGLRVSIGVAGRQGVVNTPTVYNVAFHISYFWDGRSASLEELVLKGPLQNPKEMDTDWNEVMGKLGKDTALQDRFRRLFKEGMTPATTARAIAAFLRSLVTVDSAFDRWLSGNEKALTSRQKRGYRLFKSYGCIACHQGVNLGGNMYSGMGVMGDYFSDRGEGITAADLGRFNVTGKESDRYVFKVPSLRLVVFTAPYFHDGSVRTLDEAIAVMGRYQLGREIPERDREDIAEFFRSLVGRHPLLEVTP